MNSSFGSLEAGTSLPAVSGEGSSPLAEGINEVKREIHVIAYSRTATRTDTCVACGESEQIQGELRVYEGSVHISTALVGTCQEWIFERLDLTADECRQKVDMALKGKKVCDEGR